MAHENTLYKIYEAAMTTYKSKIGIGLIIPIVIIVGGTGILMAFEKAWLGLAIILLAVAFIVHTFFTTYYRIEHSTLKIKCGFFEKLLQIDSIKEIKDTRNPISSPAISLDRIVIIYNKFDTVIISPANKEGFIKHLISLNPSIKVTLKDNPNQKSVTPFKLNEEGL